MSNARCYSTRAQACCALVEGSDQITVDPQARFVFSWAPSSSKTKIGVMGSEGCCASDVDVDTGADSICSAGGEGCCPSDAGAGSIRSSLA